MSAIVWSKFYWSDWEGDERLKMCSPGAQALWMRMLCVCARARGYLQIASKAIDADDMAKLTGWASDDVKTWWDELQAWGVFSVDRRGVVYSRKMIRETKKAETARENGRKGGNPKLSKTTEFSASDIQNAEGGEKRRSGKTPDTISQKKNLSPVGESARANKQAPASVVSLFDEEEGIETEPRMLAKPNSDIDRAVSAWNEMAQRTGLSVVAKLNDWRRKSVKARIATYGLAEWLRAVQMVGDSAHLHGQNRDQFCANFDFLVREQNFLRVIEGNYNRRQVSGRPTTGFDREPTAQQRNLASMLSAREAFVNGGRRAPDEHPGAGDDTVVSF